MTTFHAPAKPYDPITALNRRAAAVGSPRYAALTAHADYNGHQVQVWWNSYRGYYIAEYTWNGRNVLARGTFEQCLAAALQEHNRGAAGSSVVATPREDDTAAHEAALAAGLVTDEEKIAPWWTWRHDVAVQSVRDYAHPGALCALFDWPLLQAAANREEYEAAVREKHGRLYA